MLNFTLLGTVAVFKPNDKGSKTVTNTIPPPLKPPTIKYVPKITGVILNHDCLIWKLVLKRVLAPEMSKKSPTK